MGGGLTHALGRRVPSQGDRFPISDRHGNGCIRGGGGGGGGDHTMELRAWRGGPDIGGCPRVTGGGVPRWPLGPTVSPPLWGGSSWRRVRILRGNHPQQYISWVISGCPPLQKSPPFPPGPRNRPLPPWLCPMGSASSCSCCWGGPERPSPFPQSVSGAGGAGLALLLHEGFLHARPPPPPFSPCTAAHDRPVAPYARGLRGGGKLCSTLSFSPPLFAPLDADGAHDCEFGRGPAGGGWGGGL